jgi:thioredoxin reductase (NADPH)
MTSKQAPNTRQVVVVGGGPSGMSALLWCRSVGLSAVLLERAPELGGQMLQMFHQAFDYPGLPSHSGRELRDRFETHLRGLELEWKLDCRIAEINLRERRVIYRGGVLTGDAMILATGAQTRKLGVPGEEEAAGLSLSYSATGDGQRFAGRHVCVVGGGDSAFDDCLILADLCPQVTLIHRSSNFRARQSWRDAVFNHPHINAITNAEVTRIEVAGVGGGAGGRMPGLRLSLHDRKTGASRRVETDGLFVRIGVEPNTSFVRGQLELDDEGYVVVDRAQRTSVENIYAVGDVSRPVCLSVATAVGQGAVAVKDIAERLKLSGAAWR